MIKYRPPCVPRRSASLKLAARCRGERRSITRGSVSSHRDYGERMGLSFNKEIQSGYYQNTSVSVEGASLEWVDEGGNKHTRYKQDAATTTRNMRDELCVDGNPLDLVLPPSHLPVPNHGALL